MMTFLPLALLWQNVGSNSPGAASKTTANYQARERQTLGMDAQPEPRELPAIRA